MRDEEERQSVRKALPLIEAWASASLKTASPRFQRVMYQFFVTRVPGYLKTWHNDLDGTYFCQASYTATIRPSRWCCANTLLQS